MNSFGLGLVLNFTDNASAGMRSVSQTFNEMNGLANKMVDSSNSAVYSVTTLAATGATLSMVGESVSQLGSSITGIFAEMSQSVINTGMTMQGFRMQLQALYGEDSYEQKIQEIKDYARTSVFEVEGLMSAVTVMKAVGIEAMNEVTTSSGQTTQKLMDYASDIAAMVPNMRNVYGTGVNAAMGALKEYIAEGNALSLKRGAGFDITGILGEDKGKTIEERTQQVADLVEKLGIAGYTAQLAGTPTQQLANLQDALFNTMSDIADSGVFESYTMLLSRIAEWVSSLIDDTDKYNTIVKLLGDTITTIMTPLGKLLDYVIRIADAFIDWASDHPVIAKGLLITVAALGAFLVVGGQVLKLAGGFFMISSSLLQMSNLAKNGISIFNIFGRSAGIMAVKLLPFIALAGIAYTAWSKNLFGIRDTLTRVFKDLVSAISLIIDAWRDNTLSEENFQKASKLGILPLIENLLDLKYRFDFLKKGFVEGWNEISAVVTSTVLSITNSLNGTIFQPLVDKAREFLETFAGSDTQAWFDFGKSLAKFTTIAAGLIPVVSVVTRIAKAVSGLAPIVKTIFSVIASNPVIAVIVAVVAGLTLLYTKCEAFRNFVNGLFSSISEMFKNTIGKVILTFKASLITLRANISPLKDAFMSFLPQLGGFLTKIVGFVGQLIEKVIQLVANLLPSIIKVTTVIAGAVMQVLPLILNILETVFSVVSDLLLPIIFELIDLVVPFITQITDIATELIDGVITVIVGLLEDIIPVISSMIQLIIPMIRNIFNSLKPVITTILNIVTTITARLVPVLKNIFGIAADIIKMVINIAVPIITVIMQVVEAIIAILMPILNVIIQVIGFIIDIVMGIVQAVVSVVAAIVKVVTGLINIIVGILSAIIQAIMSIVSVIVGIVTTVVSTVTSIISGIIAVFQYIWDAIVTIFSGVIDFFAGIFGAVFDVVAGIFQNIANFFAEVWNEIVLTFTTIGDTISGAIKGAINTVIEGAVGIVNGFIKAINFAIGVINAIPGVSITKLNLLQVPQLAEGGVVDKPTTAIIGEAGQEAVVPLENNTEWIDKVAHKLVPKINSEQSSSVNKSETPEVHNDYSVTFSAGSIVIQLTNATEAELEKAAEKLMKIIERKQQLKAMAVRA